MLSDTCPVSQSYAHVLCRSISCRTYFEMPNTSVAEHRDFGYVLQNTLRNFLGVQNRVRNFVGPLVNRFWTIFDLSILDRKNKSVLQNIRNRVRNCVVWVVFVAGIRNCVV